MGSIPEHPFDQRTEGGPEVISERTRKRQEALERTREARRRVLDEPAIRARSKEVLEEIARGDKPKDGGVTEEELPDFLREHNG